jgi:hypothetical protein
MILVFASLPPESEEVFRESIVAGVGSGRFGGACVLMCAQLADGGDARRNFSVIPRRSSETRQGLLLWRTTLGKTCHFSPPCSLADLPPPATASCHEAVRSFRQRAKIPPRARDTHCCFYVLAARPAFLLTLLSPLLIWKTVVQHGALRAVEMGPERAGIRRDGFGAGR